jgi:hypothetical protein
MRKSLLLALVSVVALGVFAASAGADASAAGSRLLVYTDTTPHNQQYSAIGIATGLPVDVVFEFPGSLNDYSCVVLPTNVNPFGKRIISALSRYIDSGGRVIASGDGSAFGVQNGHVNALAAGLGSGLSIIPRHLDTGKHMTTNIDPSVFTIGVSTLLYAYTSEVGIATSGTGHSLVRADDGSTVILAAEFMGDGAFVLSGDRNIFSDTLENSHGSYSLYDNDVLANNICNGDLGGPGDGSKVGVLEGSGIDGVGLSSAPGLQGEFNSRSRAAENAGKK